MNIFRSFDEIEFNPATVLTVGTFDGVHLGHQSIIHRLNEISENEGLRPFVLTIDPHPQIVLQKPDRPPVYLLTTISERLHLFERFGVQNVLILNFTYEFSQTPPEIFIKSYLHEKIGMKKMLIGYDHLFGHNREGNEDLLQNLSKDMNFEIEKIPPLVIHDEIISSTRIRNALKNKDVRLTKEYLGYDYLVEGTVAKGDGRGSTIGYPTINLDYKEKHKLMPPNGVYLVSADFDGKIEYGMANLGTRPTFLNDGEQLLETNLFDFSQDVYGRNVKIAFIEFLRDEIKFQSVNELVEKIKDDEKRCREILRRDFPDKSF